MKEVIESNYYGWTEKEMKIETLKKKFKENEKELMDLFVEFNVKLIDVSLNGFKRLLEDN